MGKSSQNKTLVAVQKLASNSAVKVQKLINKSNREMMRFNSSEAEKQRSWSHNESELTRQFNAAEAEKERVFNSAEAEKNRQWQEYMSNTSHQREVKDLQAAGLNPVLSVNQGAMSYTGASASAGAASSTPASGASASAQLDSGANSYANIMGSLFGSMVNLKSAEMSAEALKYSAKTSAAAQKYSSDRAYEAAKYSADTQYRIAMDRPATNAYQLVDKYFGGNKEELKSNIAQIWQDPTAFFKGESASASKFSLTKFGFKEIGKKLLHLGVEVSTTNVKLYVKGFVFGIPGAVRALYKNKQKRDAYAQR